MRVRWVCCAWGRRVCQMGGLAASHNRGDGGLAGVSVTKL